MSKKFTPQKGDSRKRGELARQLRALIVRLPAGEKRRELIELVSTK